MASQAPCIFSDTRRVQRRKRMLAVGDSARFVLEDMIEDVLERLAFIRLEPARSLIIGDVTSALAAQLSGEVVGADIFGSDCLDLSVPYLVGEFDFIAVLGLLDTINDLPGALVHLRHALAPGGRVIASFPGAGSLPNLRAAMLAAEPDRTAARMHPLVDARAGAQLLQRAGWSDPVVDTHDLVARYSTLDRLVHDLREQGLGNVLASPSPPIGKAALERARRVFLDRADPDGKVSETFSILTLSGRRSLAGT